MTYQIIAIVALVIAIAAILYCINLRHQLYTYVGVIKSDLRDLNLRMKNFADAKMLERKEQRHAEQKN